MSIDFIKDELIELKIDAVPNIVRAKWIVVKLAWFFVLLMSASGCLFLVVSSIISYLAYPVTTNIRVFYPEQAPFPTISICQRNPLSTDYAVNMLLEANATNLTSLEIYTKKATGSYLSEDERRSLGNDIALMLVECQFGASSCNASDFEHVWHPLYQNCFRFNSVRGDEVPKQIHLSGPQAPLRVRLYAGLPDLFFYNPLGFYLFIHNHTDYPFNTYESPILVTPGFGALIGLQRTFNHQFNDHPYAYSECRIRLLVEEGEAGGNELLGAPIKDTFLYDQVVATNSTYSRETCIMFCAQQIIADRCQCNAYHINFKMAGHEPCLNFTQIHCADQVLENVRLLEDTCISKCPLECSSHSFLKTPTYYDFPSTQDVADLQANELFSTKYANQQHFTQYLSSSLVEFSIYYDSFSYTMIEEEEAIPLDTLIGSIGAHLHLFLGMSLISFVECIEFVAKLLYHLSNQKKNEIVSF